MEQVVIEESNCRVVSKIKLDNNNPAPINGPQSLVPEQHAMSPRVFQNTAELIQFKEDAKAGKIRKPGDYGRQTNPTIEAYEKILAQLDHAEEALLFPSGMSAITCALSVLLPEGSHLILGENSYRRTRTFCQTWLKRLGVTTSVVPMSDLNALEKAVTPQTKLILLESPSNPHLRVIDIPKLAAFARSRGILTMIDATFASPINQSPIDFGIDIVNHSATKYLSGHNTIVAGSLSGSWQLLKPIFEYRAEVGCIPDARVASDLILFAETLRLRVREQNRNAQEVAEFLENHPAIKRVWYPGLKSHPDHAIAREQLSGFGGVVSFEYEGSREETSRFIDQVVSNFDEHGRNVFSLAPSLGGTRTLIEQPAIISYYSFNAEFRKSFGITDNLVRLSLGVEDSGLLISLLSKALGQWRGSRSH